MILVEKMFVCNKSSSMSIACQIYGELQEYGFNMWVHSFKGTFIRTLKGVNTERKTTLNIDSFDLKDIGDYTCHVWVKYDSKLVHVNATSLLTIEG